MSLRSRARNVQRAAKLSYQQAVQALRALGDKPAALARRCGWPLSRADLYLVDKWLDAEYREAAALGGLVLLSPCETCHTGFFMVVGSGERGCPAHRGSRQEQVLRRACEEARARCDALAVAVVLRDGRELAWAGERDAGVRAAVRMAMRELTWRDRPAPSVIEMRGGAPSTLLLAQVGDAGAVAAHFDGGTSLARVAVTLQPLLDLLEARLRDTLPSQGWPPRGGGRGPSGAAARAWEVRPFLEAPAGRGDEVEPLDLPGWKSRLS